MLWLWHTGLTAQLARAGAGSLAAFRLFLRKKKSGPRISSSVGERAFKKILDVDDLTNIVLLLQPQSRKHQRRSPRRPPQRKLLQRRL